MRTPLEISESLTLVADLMELNNENEFKIRAYRVAAEILADYPAGTDLLQQQIASRQIAKIGQNLAEQIAEFAIAESSAESEALSRAVPLSLLEVKAIPGLGPKKVRILWQQLGVTNIDQLEQCCLKDQLLTLKGFGQKQQDKILSGISQIRRYKGLMRQPAAIALAQYLSKIISENFPAAKTEVVGELRRKLEVIEVLELLVSGPEAKKLESLLRDITGFSCQSAEQPFVLQLLTRQSEKILIHLVREEQFSAQIIRSTGCAEFVKWADEKLDLQNKSARSETELFKEAEIEFIAPELREKCYMDLWGSASLPAEESLISLSQIKGIIHCHSVYSDGANELKDMAIAAKQQGYLYLGIADHSVSARYAGGLYPEKISKQHKEIDQLNTELAPFRILKGIESDITKEGDLDYPQEILKTFDFIVASIHSGFTMSKEEMTARVVKALRNPYTSILGHPTGRLLLTREPFPIDMQQVIKVAVEEGVILEINANPYRLDLDWRWVKYARELGARFSINPDAHRIPGFSDLQYGVNVARKGGLTAVDVVNTSDSHGFLENLRRKSTGLTSGFTLSS